MDIFCSAKRQTVAMKVNFIQSYSCKPVNMYELKKTIVTNGIIFVARDNGNNVIRNVTLTITITITISMAVDMRQSV